MRNKKQNVPQVGHYTNVFIERGLFGLPARFICSGQKPLVVDLSKPEGFSVCAGGIEAQTVQALSNIRQNLKEKNLTFKDVSKVQVFLADLSDFQKFDATYAEFLHNAGCGNHKPARAVTGCDIRYNAGIEVVCEGSLSIMYPFRNIARRLKQSTRKIFG